MMQQKRMMAAQLLKCTLAIVVMWNLRQTGALFDFYTRL